MPPPNPRYIDPPIQTHDPHCLSIQTHVTTWPTIHRSTYLNPSLIPQLQAHHLTHDPHSSSIQTHSTMICDLHQSTPWPCCDHLESNPTPVQVLNKREMWDKRGRSFVCVCVCVCVWERERESRWETKVRVIENKRWKRIKYNFLI